MKSISITITSINDVPKILPENCKRITITGDCILHRAVETNNAIYFCNYKDDEVVMYNKSGLTLASNNYFAENSLYSLMYDEPESITYISPTAKYNLREIQKEKKAYLTKQF